jgi:hypothetical protein
LVHSTSSVYSSAREQDADDLEWPTYSLVDWRRGGDEAGDGDELKGIAEPLNGSFRRCIAITLLRREYPIQHEEMC